MISRRSFLERAAAAAACLGLNSSLLADDIQHYDTPLYTGTLRPWVDPLPIPEFIKPVGSRPDPENPSQSLPFYRMALQELHYKIHRDLPPTRVWGFNNSSPGPIFETRSGQGLLVEWANQLPKQHFLPIDHTLHGAESNKPDVRSVIHLHGGKTPFTCTWFAFRSSTVAPLTISSTWTRVRCASPARSGRPIPTNSDGRTPSARSPA